MQSGTVCAPARPARFASPSGFAWIGTPVLPSSLKRVETRVSLRKQARGEPWIAPPRGARAGEYPIDTLHTRIAFFDSPANQRSPSSGDLLPTKYEDLAQHTRNIISESQSLRKVAAWPPVRHIPVRFAAHVDQRSCGYGRSIPGLRYRCATFRAGRSGRCARRDASGQSFVSKQCRKIDDVPRIVHTKFACRNDSKCLERLMQFDR